jgi:hypothetical protein
MRLLFLPKNLSVSLAAIDNQGGSMTQGWHSPGHVTQYLQAGAMKQRILCAIPGVCACGLFPIN